MTRFLSAASIVFLLGMAVPASAHFGFLIRPRPITAYYLAVPVVPVWVTPAVVCMPVPVENAPPRPYAQPQPAPSSSAKEPPLAEPGKPTLPSNPTPSPEQKQSQNRQSSYFDAYAVAPSAARAPATSNRCSVSFWNLSGRELILKVGERRVTLDSGRSSTLNLDRQFTWQIEGRDPQNGRIAATDSALEIVIRR